VTIGVNPLAHLYAMEVLWKKLLLTWRCESRDQKLIMLMGEILWRGHLRQITHMQYGKKTKNMQTMNISTNESKQFVKRAQLDKTQSRQL